ncbi:hypothetical protein AN477_03965 [Alicyclobacillus ferrooxydans]|uniref:DUF1805 domain-containing protein n=2 Tax=Alicyclobacillus ferrooxydans TaxID=471514 RepID=A0A0P9CQJ2_9BACL|nr:DUF1805 domain-containing protein [Alicyclobacillus ferrooxydans]KPV45166.1 hypothetical protein AN477_03965 [Alicyclobacillus ferrooxydans]
MVKVEPRKLGEDTVLSIEVKLPKTNLLVFSTQTGYVMCGALDIGLLRTKLRERGVIAARAVGVRTMDDLWNGTIESCTQAAEAIGIHAGMAVQDALTKMIEAERVRS